MYRVKKLMRIHTTITDDKKIIRLTKNAVKMAQKYGAVIKIAKSNAPDTNDLICECEIFGITRRFCAGIITEITQALKASMKCPISSIATENESIPDWVYQYSHLFNEEENEEGAK